MKEFIYFGGLMRCCLKTIDERTEPAADGERQPCKWCTSGAVFREGPDKPRARADARGYWEWDRS